MALEAENNGNIVENGGDNENIGGMNNNLTAMMDLRIAGVNTQLLVVTQFLQRCSGSFEALLVSSTAAAISRATNSHSY